MFVNCQLCGWVIRIEPSRMTTVLVRCESLLIGSICLGSHGFAHPVKVDVRLVSFPCPAFEMTWPQKYDPLHNVALSTASSSTASRWRRWWAFWFCYSLCVSIHRNCGEIIPRLLTSVVATFFPVQSARQFPLRHAATIASRQRRA